MEILVMDYMAYAIRGMREVAFSLSVYHVRARLSVLLRFHTQWALLARRIYMPYSSLPASTKDQDIDQGRYNLVLERLYKCPSKVNENSIR
jgi:hypothetical protein